MGENTPEEEAIWSREKGIAAYRHKSVLPVHQFNIKNETAPLIYVRLMQTRYAHIQNGQVSVEGAGKRYILCGIPMEIMIE